MKYALEIESGAMRYMQIFITTGSVILKFNGEGVFTNTQTGDGISLLSFFKNK
jgi:hypothetical protein